MMADTLVERLTGQRQATGVPPTVDLLISDASLLGGGTEPAEIPGYGPVPAEIVREMIANGLDDPETTTWLRRLYTDPAGDLIAMTSIQRFYRGALADYLRLRDHGICRTPWCDAPIADADHVVPVEAHGPTTVENGQGLCRACDHTKQTPGWTQSTARSAPITESRHRVITTTPTRHTYGSTAPPPPATSRTRPTSLDLVIDRLVEQLVGAA